jgi:hypothetical protein
MSTITSGATQALQGIMVPSENLPKMQVYIGELLAIYHFSYISLMLPIHVVHIVGLNHIFAFVCGFSVIFVYAVIVL